MINDFFIIFAWWFLLFGLGVIFLPLTWFFFRKFFDLGYPFSKIIAILLVSYFVWLTGSLHILPFSALIIWLVILILVLGNIFLARKFRKEITQSIKSHWQILVFEEIIFFTALAFWSFIRGFQPNIEGLEKFMDFGFINSILRTQYFPPADMWMAGKTVNYYYFGHLVAAVLTKLSTFPSTITYNLMIATITALTFTATFSLGSNLYHQLATSLRHRSSSIIAGCLSALVLSFGGNLHSLWWFLTHNFSFTGYWYPDATRFIVEKFGAADNTIHEFPIYSSVVSDLHGHFSDIPFVLLFLALLFSLLVSNKFSIFNFQFSIPLGLVLAVMYMTNSWDFPIYFLVFGVIILCLNYQKYGLALQTFSRTLLFTVYCLLFTIIFSLPFHLNFSQIAQGIDFVHARSPIWQLFVLWGYQWFLAAVFLIFLILKKRITNYKLQITDYFVLILLLIATLLIIIPELIYVKDIYIASHHRANTMFKLVYQSFMLYAIASGYIVIRIFNDLQMKFSKILLFTFYSLLLTFLFIYPYFAVKSYYGDLKTYRGLDGSLFLRQNYPDNFAALLWLKQNIKGQPVVLEAVGDSYTDYNQVSSFTGLPTVEGWLVHEWLWRGSFDEPGKRAADVQIIFQSQNIDEIEPLLKKYQVKYIFVGQKEQEKYRVNEDVFRKLGKLVFSQGNTRIYLLEKSGSQ